MPAQTRHVVGVGAPIEYLGIAWTVRSILKHCVVLEAVGNPSRTTRIEFAVFEQLVDERHA